MITENDWHMIYDNIKGWYKQRIKEAKGYAVSEHLESKGFGYMTAKKKLRQELDDELLKLDTIRSWYSPVAQVADSLEESTYKGEYLMDENSAVFLENASSNRTHCRQCKTHVPKGHIRVVIMARDAFGPRRYLYCMECGKDILVTKLQQLTEVLDKVNGELDHTTETSQSVQQFATVGE